MKLATLADGTRDGRLLVVRKDGRAATPSDDRWPTMQRALDHWDEALPSLQKLAAKLDSGAIDGVPLDETRLAAPLPRAYEWVDGSAFLNHVILVRKARGAEPPPTLQTDPLVYQGGSSEMLAPRAPIVLHDAAWGLDYESEVCVILGDVPLGTKAADINKYVRLIVLANDCTLRNLVPNELAKSFGFFQSKPATAFSPIAITPDELGDAWLGARLGVLVHSVNLPACSADPLASMGAGEVEVEWPVSTPSQGE